MQTRPVALLDSGAGALTVLAALWERVPDVDIVYYADTAFVPYGDRTLEEIAFLGDAIARHLLEYEPSAIVVASGSTCAAFDACGWPADVPNVVGVVQPGARAAVAASSSGAIGVVATSATVRSRVFERAIQVLAPDSRVTGVPAPALVPIVEAGESKSERARRAVAIACRPLVAARCDAVILGCTHFPHLRGWFEEALGRDVAIVDPAVGTADDVAALVRAAPGGGGRLIVEVSGNAEEFAANAVALSGVNIAELRHVELVRSDEIVGRR